MAEKIISPGVFTSEIDQSFLPAAIGDIGAAVIGPTVKGPALVPTVVNSYSEFQQKFGDSFTSGSQDYVYLTSLTAQNYLKHSGKLTVVRILDGTYSQASASIEGGGTSTASTIGSGSFTITDGQFANQEFTIGGVDFVFISGSTSVFDNNAAEIFIESGSTVTSSADNFTAAVNNNVSTHGLTISASNTLGLVNFYTGSYSMASSSAFFTGGSGSMAGATAGTGGTAFEIHTLADGAIMNSIGGTVGSTKLLPSGSKDNLRYEISNRNLKKGTFTLLVRSGNDIEKRKQVIETWNNLSLDPNSNNYIEKLIGSQYYTLKSDDGTYLQPTGDYLIKSKYIRVANVYQLPDYIDENGDVNVAKYPGYNVSGTLLPTVGSGSSHGSFGGGTDGNIQHPQKFFKDIDGSGANALNSQGYQLNNLTNENGGTSYSEALDLLANQDEYDINMIFLPGVTNDNGSAIIEKAINTAEDRGDCFVIADPVVYGSTLAGATTQAEAKDSNYAAMYWPWVQVPEPTLGRNVWVPPSTVMGGIFAFNDKVAHEWFAPAGMNRGGVDVAIQAERKLTQANRDTLYESNVNPIATFPGQGITVWGQKTLQKKASALDRINVRRLLIRVKKFIAASSRFLVFEQNNSKTRGRFLSIVNPFLEQVQSNSGLNAFKVVMDETNNTADVVDRNILYGQIFVQPTRTAEFIVLDFTVQPTGATFDG
jgi:hypothetical protein